MTAQRPARSGRRRPPLPPGQPLFTPGASPARQAVERRSAAPLLYLRQIPAWVFPIALVVLLIVGLRVHGPLGAVALLGVAAVLGWLASVSWPRLRTAGRLGRLIVIALVVAGAVLQATR